MENFFSILIVLSLTLSCSQSFKAMGNKVKIRGLEVHKEYYSRNKAMITHGLFEIENGGLTPRTVEIKKVTCVHSQQKIEISEFYLYVLPDYKEIEGMEITLGAKEKFSFEVSFPFLDPPQNLASEVFIEIEVQHVGKKQQIKSPYTFTIRKRK